MTRSPRQLIDPVATPLSMRAVTALWIWSRRNLRVLGARGRGRASAAKASAPVHQLRYLSTSARKASVRASQATRLGGPRKDGLVTVVSLAPGRRPTASFQTVATLR